MPSSDVETQTESAPESAARREYEDAFARFKAGLSRGARARLNGSGVPDWAGGRTFALAVQPDNPAYSSEPGDPVFETLEELAQIEGALAKIALWINDRIGVLRPVLQVDQFRIAIARIERAKNPRLEALLTSLAIGMNLHASINGYEIARHFNLKPQTCHEMLAATCEALGVPKPLSKANKKRYRHTQYRHNMRRKVA